VTKGDQAAGGVAGEQGGCEVEILRYASVSKGGRPVDKTVPEISLVVCEETRALGGRGTEASILLFLSLPTPPSPSSLLASLLASLAMSSSSEGWIIRMVSSEGSRRPRYSLRMKITSPPRVRNRLSKDRMLVRKAGCLVRSSVVLGRRQRPVLGERNSFCLSELAEVG
jgi:hypothetical protein